MCSTCGIEVVATPAGLINLGSTCYLAASVQALACVLSDFGTADALRALVGRMATSALADPTAFRDACETKMFGKFQQGREHDAGEFVVKIINVFGINDFRMSMKQVITCGCSNRIPTCTSEDMLQMTCDDARSQSLRSQFALYTQKNASDDPCSACNKPFYLSCEVATWPRVFAIQLGRQGTEWREKVPDTEEWTEEDGTLHKKVVGPEAGTYATRILDDIEFPLILDEHYLGVTMPRYTLHAVIHAEGGENSDYGHYTASGKYGSVWYWMNDSTVEEEAAINHSTAYVLFYVQD
jgi:ubiquitin C-terminal hydrolase